MVVFNKNKMNAIDFIANRRAGFINNGLNYQSSLKLDFDYWVRRFACTKRNSFVVPGQYCTDCPPFSCKFHKESNVLAVASEEGDILMLNGSLSSRGEMLLKRWNAHGNAIFDICWVPKKQLLSASGDHTIALHDVETSEKITTFIKHSGSVKSIDTCHSQPAVFASGSRDGAVIVWDMRVGGLLSQKHNDKPEIIINDAHSQNSWVKKNRSSISNQLRSVTAISFKDEHNIASAGVSDSTIKIWDLRKTYIVNNKSLPVPKESFHFGDKSRKQGCTSLQFDSTYNYLFACCTDNSICKFDCRSAVADAETCYYGLKTQSYFIKLSLSPDDQYIVCGSSNQNALIWKVSQPGPPIAKLSGHFDEVTAVEWHPTDISKLATCGDDNLVFIWNIVGSDRDFSDTEILGSCNNEALECHEEKQLDSEHEDNSYLSSPREVKLKERSLREFFNSSVSAPRQVVENNKNHQRTKKGSSSGSKNSISQPLGEVSSNFNRKRKLMDSEGSDFHSSTTSEERLNEDNIDSSSENNAVVSVKSSEDKENLRTSVNSPSPLKNSVTNSATETSCSSKKLCKTMSGKSPHTKKRSPKIVKPKTKLITSYFHAESTSN